MTEQIDETVPGMETPAPPAPAHPVPNPATYPAAPLLPNGGPNGALAAGMTMQEWLNVNGLGPALLVEAL